MKVSIFTRTYCNVTSAILSLTENKIFQGKGFKEVYNFEEIDKHLSHYSYICGYVPSKPDVDVAKALKSLDFSNYKYIKRWWNHMRSFSDTEVSLFPDFRQPNFLKYNSKKILESQVCEKSMLILKQLHLSCLYEQCKQK